MNPRFIRLKFQYDEMLYAELMEFGYVLSHFECEEVIGEATDIRCKHTITTVQHDTTKDIYYIRLYNDTVVEFKKLN